MVVHTFFVNFPTARIGIYPEFLLAVGKVAVQTVATPPSFSVVVAQFLFVLDVKHVCLLTAYLLFVVSPWW